MRLRMDPWATDYGTAVQVEDDGLDTSQNGGPSEARCYDEFLR